MVAFLASLPREHAFVVRAELVSFRRRALQRATIDSFASEVKQTFSGNLRIDRGRREGEKEREREADRLNFIS